MRLGKAWNAVCRVEVVLLATRNFYILKEHVSKHRTAKNSVQTYESSTTNKHRFVTRWAIINYGWTITASASTDKKGLAARIDWLAIPAATGSTVGDKCEWGGLRSQLCQVAT